MAKANAAQKAEEKAEEKTEMTEAKTETPAKAHCEPCAPTYAQTIDEIAIAIRKLTDAGMSGPTAGELAAKIWMSTR